MVTYIIVIIFVVLILAIWISWGIKQWAKGADRINKEMEKDRPSSEVLQKSMETLLNKWPKVAGKELSGITRPLAFTGRKARRLLVQAESGSRPPWGGWEHLSHVESERRTFTQFRAAVNKSISPHEVDHIDFISRILPKQDTPADADKPSR
jgi:hypothetical protein